MRRPRRPKTIFEQKKKEFRKLPGGLTLDQIMQRLGIRYSMAYRWCQAYGYAPKLHYGANSDAQKLRRKQMQRLPPNLTVKQIARRLKIRAGSIYAWIHDTGYVFRKAYKKVPHERWREVDWTMWDAEIARTLNVSRELVRTMRIKLRKPKSPFQGLRAKVGKPSPVLSKFAARRRPGPSVPERGHGRR